MERKNLMASSIVLKYSYMDELLRADTNEEL